MSKNNSDTKRNLILALINDDESAFCELYISYKNRLVYFAMKYIKSRELAEDIYQETFIAIWQNRKCLNPDTPFAPYIYTIVKNRVIDLIAELDKNERLKDKIISEAVNYSNNTENALLDKELNNILQKALLDLTPQQKRIFDMSRKEMKSHKEISKELNISVYTVQQHISASLKVIKTYLVKYTGTYTDIVLILLYLSVIR